MKRAAQLHGNEGLRLRCTSWNILADSLMRSNRHLYVRCDSSALQIHIRLPRLLEQLSLLQSDVLGLQEVEYFDQNFAPWMSRTGYRGLFKKRTGEQLDGVAIFFRESRFDLIHNEALEFRVLAEGCASQEEADRMRKDNVALICVLLDRWSGRELVVSCCHLLWNPKRGVRQGYILEVLAVMQRSLS